LLRTSGGDDAALFQGDLDKPAWHCPGFDVRRRQRRVCRNLHRSSGLFLARGKRNRSCRKNEQSESPEHGQDQQGQEALAGKLEPPGNPLAAGVFCGDLAAGLVGARTLATFYQCVPIPRRRFGQHSLPPARVNEWNERGHVELVPGHVLPAGIHGDTRHGCALARGLMPRDEAQFHLLDLRLAQQEAHARRTVQLSPVGWQFQHNMLAAVAAKFPANGLEDGVGRNSQKRGHGRHRIDGGLARFAGAGPPANSAKVLLYPRGHAAQGFGQLLTVLAAGLGHVRCAASAPVHQRRDAFDQVAGVHAALG